MKIILFILKSMVCHTILCYYPILGRVFVEATYDRAFTYSSFDQRSMFFAPEKSLNANVFSGLIGYQFTTEVGLLAGFAHSSNEMISETTGSIKTTSSYSYDTINLGVRFTVYDKKDFSIFTDFAGAYLLPFEYVRNSVNLSTGNTTNNTIEPLNSAFGAMAKLGLSYKFYDHFYITTSFQIFHMITDNKDTTIMVNNGSVTTNIPVVNLSDWSAGKGRFYNFNLSDVRIGLSLGYKFTI